VFTLILLLGLSNSAVKMGDSEKEK
jgi:hypothetical protein